MTNEERLLAAMEYQQAMRAALGNQNLMQQGRRMNLPARQAPGALSEFVTKGMSLNPQPDQGYGTMAADMALSFIPGVGQAMAARDLERARRDSDPLGMALAGTSFVPFGKLIGALRGGKQMGPVSQLDVYHGSPHKFDQLDASKIGTGEGAQAYGHGLYLAENPGVAKEYAKNLSENRLFDAKGAPFDVQTNLSNPNVRAALYKTNGDIDAAIARARQAIEAIPGTQGAEYAAKDIQTLTALKSAGGLQKQSGNLYKVDLPDAQIAKFLDWDKPLSQQSKEVQKAFLSTRKNLTPMDIENLGGRAAVNQLYGMDNTVGDFLGTWQSLRGSKDAGEKMLQEAGIPGIRYLDAGSRSTSAGELIGVAKGADGWQAKIRKTPSGQIGDVIPMAPSITTSKSYPTEQAARDWANSQIGGGTSNFVVFPGSESMLTILERNNQNVGNMMKQTVPESSLMYKDPFGEID